MRAATATNLFKLLLKYRPEDKKEKKVRHGTASAPLRQRLTAHAASFCRSAC